MASNQLYVNDFAISTDCLTDIDSSLDSGSGLYRSLDTVKLTVVSSAVLTVVTGAPWFGLEAVFLL